MREINIIHLMLGHLFIIFAEITSSLQFGRNEDLKISGRADRVITTFKIWPNNTVVYDLDAFDLGEGDLNAIKSAMASIEQHTCVRWVERFSPITFNDNVYISKDSWCWNHEMTKRGNGVACKPSALPETPHHWKTGLLLHELLYVLGLPNEHQRPDRDEHITVNWNNLKSGNDQNYVKNRNFKVASGMEYDYKSVMHFSAYMNARNPSIPVLTPQDSDIDLEDLGHGLELGYLTELDIEKVNKIYPCPSSNQTQIWKIIQGADGKTYVIQESK